MELNATDSAASFVDISAHFRVDLMKDNLKKIFQSYCEGMSLTCPVVLVILGDATDLVSTAFGVAAGTLDIRTAEASEIVSRIGWMFPGSFTRALRAIEPGEISVACIAARGVTGSYVVIDPENDTIGLSSAPDVAPAVQWPIEEFMSPRATRCSRRKQGRK